MINALEKVVYPNGKTKAIADLIPGSVSSIIDEVHNNTSAIASITSQLSTLVGEVNTNTSAITAINAKLTQILKTAILRIQLPSLSWSLDSGKYYANTGETFGTEIIATTLNNWNNLTVTDDIIPLIQGNTFKLMSNTNSFAEGSYVDFKVLYNDIPPTLTKKKAVVKKKGETI